MSAEVGHKYKKLVDEYCAKHGTRAIPLDVQDKLWEQAGFTIPHTPPNQPKTFCRGATCTDLQTAIKINFHLPNESSKDNATTRHPPGLFFSAGKGSQNSAEHWATMAATRENRQPVAIAVTVTAENFPTVRGNIHHVIDDGHGREYYRYQAPQSFEDLKEMSVTIRLRSLSKQQLIELNTEIGTTASDGRFEWRKLVDL